MAQGHRPRGARIQSQSGRTLSLRKYVSPGTLSRKLPWGQTGWQVVTPSPQPEGLSLERGQGRDERPGPLVHKEEGSPCPAGQMGN